MAVSAIKPLKASVIAVRDILFSKEKLQVPVYQRPYKWSVRNVNQLIDDILLNYKKEAYRLGTIVLQRKDGLNIVDGQQRLLTLTILAAELLTIPGSEKVTCLDREMLSLADYRVTDPISLKNLRRNHLLVMSRLGEFTTEKIDFFFNGCELVRLELTDISEAFQFFDAQNARGKDLEPHDLLKAFHLREMAGDDSNVISVCVAGWEDVADNLADYFANYLFRIKRWLQGRSGLNFSKEYVDIFKGVQLKRPEPFPFQKGYGIIHFEDHVRQTARHVVREHYPFQLDQTMVNGQRFFEFVAFYVKRIEEVRTLSVYGSDPLVNKLKSGNPLALEILSVLNTYRGRGRRGDRYLRNLFDCSLIYYRDRFGLEKIDEALIRFFFWVYKLRLEKAAIQDVTADTLGYGIDSYFRAIRDHASPATFVHSEMRPAFYIGDDKAVKDIGEIVELFKKQSLLKNG